MTDLPPAGDRPEPEDVPAEPAPPAPEPPAMAPPEPSVPQWTSAEAAPAPAPEPAAAPAPATPAASAPVAPAPPSEAAYVAPAVVAPPPAQPPAQPAWQPPASAPPSTPEVPGSPGRYFAATVTRVAALLIDGILLGIIAGVIYAIIGVFVPGPSFDDPTRFSAASPAIIVGGIGGLIVSYLYFYLSWRSDGKATPGQRVFRMQVGNAFDGAALDTRQITVRWLTLFGLGILAAVPILAGLGGFLSFVWDIVLLVTTASSATKQGIHDRWAGSAVVATGPQNTGLAWGCLLIWIVGFVLIVALALAAIVAIFAAIYNLQ